MGVSLTCAAWLRFGQGEGNQGEEADNVFECGVAARLLRITRHSQSRNTYLVLLQGVSRVNVVRLPAAPPHRPRGAQTAVWRYGPYPPSAF